MATSGNLDAKQIFQQAVYFDYACRLLQWDTKIALSTMLPASMAPGVTPLESGVNVADVFATDLPPSLFPMIVNGALSIELYLKAIISHETGSPPQGHKLFDLFQELSPTCRTQTKTFYGEEFEKADDLVYARKVASDKSQYELENVLTKFNDVFVTIRNACEPPQMDGGSLTPIRIALLRTSLAMKPDWEQLARCLETSPTSLHPSPPTPAA